MWPCWKLLAPGLVDCKRRALMSAVAVSTLGRATVECRLRFVSSPHRGCVPLIAIIYRLSSAANLFWFSFTNFCAS